MRHIEILDSINGGNFKQKGREMEEVPLSWIGCGFEVGLEQNKLEGGTAELD